MTIKKKEMKEIEKILKIKLKEIKKQSKIDSKTKLKQVQNDNTISDNISLMCHKSHKNNSEYCFTIIENDKIINEIIHIGDIHIRLSTRHDEYKLVFNKLYNELNELKLDNKARLIYIAGDLFHTKNELQPDTIVFAWDFLKNLSDIYPIIIIMGNHDTLETNNDKTDTITSILRDRPLNNIHYLINSGVYIYNNIIFGVSSIHDNKITSRDIMDKILEENHFIDNKYIKIGLYHGQVGTLYLNPNPEIGYAGYKLRGEIDLVDFGKYDYIMLGDIHKFQYLDKDKRVAYCSSLISQNFSETDDYHGYLRWDILNSESSYHKIKNEYAYHKIDISKLLDKDNNIIIENLQDIQTGNLKITFDEMYQDIINRDIIKHQLNNIYPKLSITWQITFDNKMDIKKTLIENTEIGLTGIQINNLIRKYLLYTYVNENINIDEILEYYQNIIKSNTENIMEYESSDWKLIWLSFDNMYSYGTNNIIDFTLYPNNEIIPIFGKNNIGKSSLIDIITFMLYSRSARDETSTNPKDIINIQSNKAIGILVIESNNNKYYIERKCSRVNNKNGKQTMKCILNLFKMVDIKNSNKSEFILHNKKYNLISLNGEDRNATDKEISKIVGTYENFMNTSVLLQGNNKTFRDKSNIEKKQLLSSILKIDQYFKGSEQFILDKYKYYKLQYNTINKLLSDYSIKPLNVLENELKVFIKEIPELETKIKEYNRLRQEYYNTIEVLSRELYINKDLRISSEQDKKLEKSRINIYKIQRNDIQNKKEILLEKNETIKRNIKQLKLIENKDEIIKIYKENLNNLKDKQNDIICEISILTNKKQDKRLINIDKTFTIENQTCILEKLKKFNMDININIYNKKINEIEDKMKSLTLKEKREDIIRDNNIYIHDIKLKISQILNEISKLEIEKQCKQLLFIDNELNEQLLENKKNELIKLLQELNNKNIKKILDARDEITNNYNILMSSKESLLTSTIEILKNTIVSSNGENDKDKMIEYIDIISDTIKILFNNSSRDKDDNDNDNEDDDEEHVIKNIYNDMLILSREYEKKLEKQRILNTEIQDIENNLDNININKIIEQDKCKLEIKINKYKQDLLVINEIKLEIPEYTLLMEQEKKEMEYNNEIIILRNKLEIELLNKEKKISEIKQLQDNINIIENNNMMLEEINLLDNDIKELQNKLNVLNKDSQNDIQFKQLLIEQEIYDKYILESGENDKKIIKLEIEMSKIEQEIQQREYNIMLYKKEKLKINNNKKIEQNINDIREKIIENEKQINNINKEIILCMSSKTDIEKTINNINKNTNELKEIKKEMDIYTILLKMTGRDGLQLFLLNESLDIINTRVNNMLEPFLHKRINMKLNDEMIELSIITPDNKIIHTISGTESFFIDLVFKITIGLVSLIPKSNIIFMDESISVLDQERISSINDLFLFLKNYYSQVFLITHMNQIKNNINYSLQIKKNDDASSCVSNI